MALMLDADQEMLRDTARSFMAENGSISAQLRHWRDRDCPDGFGHELWKSFGEMGFNSILVPEAEGGLGLGHVEAGIVMEEIGRNLTPSPFLVSAIAFTEAVKGTAVGSRWLPGIMTGGTVAAVAIDEESRHRPDSIGLRAERFGNGFRLSGTKTFVVQGGSADVFLVAARTDDGLALFAVEKEADGLEVDPVRLADSSMAARLNLDGVEIDGDAMVRGTGEGRSRFERLLDAGRSAAASELIGIGSAALDMTTTYLGQRRQFGRLIGEFQALQHRAAHLYSELEIARSAVLKAQMMLDSSDEQASLMVSVAKAKAGSAATLAGQEGVQMHGGIGMTDEHDIGLYMKRDRVLNAWLGDPDFHADRVARLSGY